MALKLVTTMKTAKIEPASEAEPANNPVACRSGRLQQLADGTLQTRPLEPPALDARFSRLAALERASEVLRWHARRAEYWISPGGHLRAWLRLNICLALWLGIPAVLLTPVVTLILTTAVGWSARLAEIARNLAVIPAWLGSGLMAITGITFLLRLIRGR